MNFVDVEAVTTGNSTSIKLDGKTIVPGECQVSGNIQPGIRPDHLELATPPDIQYGEAIKLGVDASFCFFFDAEGILIEAMDARLPDIAG